jgi:signal transduction histidine kinase
LAARESYFTNDDVAVLDFIRLSSKDPFVVFAAFRNENGKTIVLPPTFRGIDLSKTGPELPEGRRVELLSSQVEAGGKTVGTAMLAYDAGKLETLVQSQVNRWVGFAVLAGACALVIAFFISVLLSKSLVVPLRRIKAGAEQVRAGKLDKLLDVERSDEIGSLARAFNDMVVQLKELEGMKRDFIAGVTHDFGTPLHAIKNALELLEEGKAGPLTSEQAEYLLMISNHLGQLSSFVANLLTSARIEAAKAEPFYETVDSLAIAREIVTLYQPEALKKGIELKLLSQQGSLAVVTDATMFRQILTNLVSNALKYTLKGAVSISLSREDGFATLQVSDTGIGIDTKDQNLIFDKFYRVRQGKNFPVQPGSGLGLSIVKGLAEAMGGGILLESQPGKGSTFTVNLLQRRPTLAQESFQPVDGTGGNGKKPSSGIAPAVTGNHGEEPNPLSVETSRGTGSSQKTVQKKHYLPGDIRTRLVHHKQR